MVDVGQNPRFWISVILFIHYPHHSGFYFAHSLANILSFLGRYLVLSRYPPCKAPVMVQCPICWVLLEKSTQPGKLHSFQFISLIWHIDAAQTSFFTSRVPCVLTFHSQHSCLAQQIPNSLRSFQTSDQTGIFASLLPEETQGIHLLAIKPPNLLICHLLSVHFLLKCTRCFLFRFHSCVHVWDNILLRTLKVFVLLRSLKCSPLPLISSYKHSGIFV